LLAGQAPGRVQVVRVDGVQPAVDLRRDGHGAAGRGQTSRNESMINPNTRIIYLSPSKSSYKYWVALTTNDQDGWLETTVFA
jgi:hypothetical protein